MDEICKTILFMSAAGSVLALVLLCLKPLTKRLFSPKWQYYIWLTVLIVMVLPIKVSMPAEPIHSTPTEKPQVQTEQSAPAKVQQEQAQPAVLEDLSQGPALRTPDIPVNIVRLSGFLWLAVAALLLGYKLVKYMVFLRAIKKYSVIECGLGNIPKRLTVRKTALLDAPLIVGLIKPVLYLPQTERKEEDLNYILLHELTHYRRHDLLYKWFAMLVTSMHWFNPFVYIVSKQMDEECEVSCDYAVCKNLSESQKKDYMEMILDFVQTAILKKRPLTTQMASSKKMLERRFIMIKNKKATSKLISLLSVIVAVAMLSTTVFASGVLSGLTEDNYTVEITNNGEKIEFTNKPFIENGEIYLPLREALEKSDFTGSIYIDWQDETQTVQVVLLNNSGLSAVYQVQIGVAGLRLQHIDTVSDIPADGEEILGVMLQLPELAIAPILKDSTTYVPLEDFNYMLYGYLNVRDADNKLCEIEYSIYDKQGNDITDQFNAVKDTREEAALMKFPETTTDLFFKAFANGDFEKMKTYCTPDCIDKFFGDGHVFGMKQAKLADIQIADTEYAKSSNDFNILVNVNMVPDENSVFYPGQTNTSFYVCLLRQEDGRYLIDTFATGL